MEAHGVKTEDEHLIPAPNAWTNQESELGYPTIPKKLCGVDQQDWVDHLELVGFCYNNSEHLATKATPFQMVTGATPFQMLMGKSLIVPTTWATHGQPPNDASEEILMVMQFDEERRRLWEMAKANFEKAHKWYNDFVNKS
jgi:hypothetical protein